jgi:hypothetical protein
MFSSFMLSNYIWEVDLEGKEKFGLTFLCPKTILNMKKPHIKNILTCAYVSKKKFCSAYLKVRFLPQPKRNDFFSRSHVTTYKRLSLRR